MTDKSNNLVHLRWLPLLRDFTECRAFLWGSAVLAWMYQSLSLAAQRGVTDIAGCTPLLMSWIYQRFPQWCPPDRGVYQYSLAARLIGLPQQSRDQHEARVLRWRVSLDRLHFDEFAWRVYDDPALQALCSPWFREEEEWGTWLSAVPLLCFSIVRFHHVDRVKWQFNGEQQLKEWYDMWHQRFEPGRRITVQHTFDTRPTLKYYDWWRGACQEVLEDSRLAELPADVQPTASQPRDDLALPRSVPDRRRRVREDRDDTRRPAQRERGRKERQLGEPVRRERARLRRVGVGVESDEEAEYAHQEEHGDIPQDREASPPPPPPHPSHRAWHSSLSYIYDNKLFNNKDINHNHDNNNYNMECNISKTKPKKQ
ncbi:hypothetical protein Ahy_B05g075460 [Arachis hypogaea]|uniref:Aminotransferase-like plant mobile domain-containing protein n=1 Tax=Arachis hypogaea TaxID=3818 RepID=A0A444Z1A4_ARAHY|nr:hypothetical protein Ahy_B05g075460 [Arachis hypogaea]